MIRYKFLKKQSTQDLLSQYKYLYICIFSIKTSKKNLLFIEKQNVA